MNLAPMFTTPTKSKSEDGKPMLAADPTSPTAPTCSASTPKSPKIAPEDNDLEVLGIGDDTYDLALAQGVEVEPAPFHANIIDVVAQHVQVEQQLMQDPTSFQSFLSVYARVDWRSSTPAHLCTSDRKARHWSLLWASSSK